MSETGKCTLFYCIARFRKDVLLNFSLLGRYVVASVRASCLVQMSSDVQTRWSHMKQVGIKSNRTGSSFRGRCCLYLQKKKY